MRGSTVRRRPECIDAEEEYVAVPRSVIDGHKNITMSVDFFVNRILMFISLSCGIGLTTVEFNPTRTVKQVVNKLS